MNASSSTCRRWPRRLLIALAVLGALYTGYRYTLHRMVEAKIDEIRKQGYPVTFAKLNNWYSEPPPSNNAADEYLHAFGQCNNSWGTNSLSKSELAITNVWPYWEGQAWMRQHLLPVIGMVRLPSSSPPLPQELRNLLDAYLSDHHTLLVSLHKSSNIRNCRYPVDFRQWFSDKNDHLTGLRRCGELLQLEVIYHVENADTKSTVDSFAALGALGNSLKDDPRDLSLLVHARMEEQAVSALQRAVNRVGFSQAQLAELDAVFGELERNDMLRRAIIGHRCMANEAYRTDPWIVLTVITNLGGTPRRSHRSDTPFSRIFDTLLRVSGLQDIDWLTYLRVTQENLAAAQLPFPQRLEQIKEPRAGIMYGLSHFFSRILLNEQSWMARRDAKAVSSIRCAQSALAIERYRLATGKLPSLANEVSNSVFASSDPFTGHALRYKKLAKGYVVYSVGADGVDDGGDEKKDITFTVER